MLIRALASQLARPLVLAPAWLRRGLTRMVDLPLGRRFDPHVQALGLMQRWYAAQPTQRVVVAVLELDAPVSHALLELALRALCARHPAALGVCDERTTTQLRLRPLTAADALPWFGAPLNADAPPSSADRLLRTDATSASDSVTPRAARPLPGRSHRDVWPLAAALTHTSFCPGAPLFRVALAPDDRHVAIALDHLIADGVSAGLFARELACLLAGQTLPAPHDDAALPLDARLDLRPSLRVLTGTLIAGRNRGFLLTPAPANMQRALRTHVVARRFAREDVESWLAQARARALTVHAIISAAALLTAAEVLGSHRSTLRLCTPISLRDRCQPRPDGIGVFIASVDADLELAPDDTLWNVAQRCTIDLERQKPAAHRTVGLLAFARDLHALAMQYENDAYGRTATVEVSNVGRIVDVPHGAAVWLTQGAHYHAALFVLTVATSDSDGALRCCLSVPDPLIAPSVAARFMELFERRLLALSAAG